MSLPVNLIICVIATVFFGWRTYATKCYYLIFFILAIDLTPLQFLPFFKADPNKLIFLTLGWILFFFIGIIVYFFERKKLNQNMQNGIVPESDQNADTAAANKDSEDSPVPEEASMPENQDDKQTEEGKDGEHE